MRRRVLLLSVLPVLACGGAAEPPPQVPVVTVPVASAPPSPPPAPPLPPEPSGLAALDLPAKVCDVSGTLDGHGVELSATPGGDTFGEVSDVPVTVSFGAGVFVEARGPAWTLRGRASPESARVLPARWLAFGGVLYAGILDRLRVDSARDGKLVVTAADVDGFTLADGARTLEVPCDAVTIDADPHRALQALPAAFTTDRKEQGMLLSRRKPVPVSAEPAGAAGGTIDASERPATVTLLERKGARARVRWGHLAGWVDASLLTSPRGSPSKLAALRAAAQFGMIGLLGGTDVVPATPGAPTAASTLVCAADVRVLANFGAVAGGPASRVVVGSIPAGKPVRVTDRGPEIAHIRLDDGRLGPGVARLAVPTRDVFAGCTEIPDTPAADKPAAVAAAASAPTDDAIDALGGEGPSTLSELPFGMGGLGLSGVGEGGGGRGEGIGLGNFGGIGHGAGTGTGQGFGSGHGRLGGTQSTSAPALREGPVQVNGRLPPEVIQRIVRQNFGRFRLCYQTGLDANPKLAGKVTVHFVIDRSGAVASAGNGGSDLPHPGVVSCVVRAFSSLSFPQPEGGIVVVDYPIRFSPGAPK